MTTTQTPALTIQPGQGFVYDPATGLFTITAGAFADGIRLQLTVPGVDGAADRSFDVGLKYESGPQAVGSLADVDLAVGDADHIIEAAALFSGQDLTFALVDAPAFVSIDAQTGRVVLAAATTFATAEIGITARNAAGSMTRRFKLTVRAASQLPVSDFSVEAALTDLGILFPQAPLDLRFHAADGGFAQLRSSTGLPVHTAWSKAGGDGIHRILFRMPATTAAPSALRRFSFGARIRAEGENLFGTRIDLYEDNGPKLQLRDYTGNRRDSISLGTTAAPFAAGAWHWLEYAIEGNVVKVRLFGQNEAAPDWLMVSTTATAAGGASGPGGYPASGIPPVIDIKRMEFVAL